MAKKNSTAKTELATLKKETVKTPEEVAQGISAELAFFKLKPNESFEMTDPITKEKKIVSFSRAGHQEKNLIMALADPDLTRDRKDFEMSMYLFGRGANSASMMVDLMRYKGEHTKETRIFKSQMRFDFEALIDSLVDHFEMLGKSAFENLGYDDPAKFISDYRTWLESSNDDTDKSVHTYLTTLRRDVSRFEQLEGAILAGAMYNLDQAEKLTRARMMVAKAREREKGGGIYVDGQGRPYSIEDPAIMDVITKEREEIAAIQKED